jgi:hypothetical protein
MKLTLKIYCKFDKQRNLQGLFGLFKDTPAVDRLSNSSVESGKLKPSDGGSACSTGSIDRRTPRAKENNESREEKEVVIRYLAI